MSSSPETAPKPKKSVALSGVVAGNTELCTVGRSGNDLHYRGYDILDFADQAEFEEVAYLLVHEKLPTRAEFDKYKARLKGLRGLPKALKTVLESIPKTAHPMDVMRTGVSALGALQPEKEDHNPYGAKSIAARLVGALDPQKDSPTPSGAKSTPARLISSLGSMLLYWHHFSRHGKRIETKTDGD